MCAFVRLCVCHICGSKKLVRVSHTGLEFARTSFCACIRCICMFVFVCVCVCVGVGVCFE